MNIVGRLPNRIFTLVPSTTVAILNSLPDPPADCALVFLCRKFYTSFSMYLEESSLFTTKDDSASLRVHCCRVYTTDHRLHATDAVPRQLCWLRLPRVLELRGSDAGSWFVITSRGLYSWGANSGQSLGTGARDIWVAPARVHLPGHGLEVLDVVPYDRATFINTNDGWFGCGAELVDLLGPDAVTAPQHLPNPRDYTRFHVGQGMIFAWTPDQLLAAGLNNNGTCGVGSNAVKVTPLTPVDLPPAVAGGVDRVVIASWATFFLAGRRCFVTGDNEYGQLGIRERRAVVPRELPFPVDDVACHQGLTIFCTDAGLRGCGVNTHGQLIPHAALTPADPRVWEVHVPTLVETPFPPTAIAVYWTALFIRDSDGMWHGRGKSGVVPGVPSSGWGQVEWDDVQALGPATAEVEGQGRGQT